MTPPVISDPKPCSQCNRAIVGWLLDKKGARVTYGHFSQHNGVLVLDKWSAVECWPFWETDDDTKDGIGDI